MIASLSRYVTVCFLLASGLQATPQNPNSFSSFPPEKSRTEPPHSPEQRQTHPFKPIPREKLPSMEKPFGMPGIVGLQNGRWAGSDYLGYLSNHIAIDVEILKGENVPEIPDTNFIEDRIANLFQASEIDPHAEVKEGPPLPFVHILLFVYPAGNNNFVVFGAVRLFEQIQVLRNNFNPSGYWQGITWESQNVILAPADQLSTQVVNLAEALANDFIKRYRSYVPVNPKERPPIQQ